MLKNIKWWKVVWIFIPPLILSWPILPDYTPFPLKKDLKLKVSEQVGVSELPKEFPIQGVSNSMGSKAFLSTFIGVIKTSSMPVELCFSNQNKIRDGENEIDPRTLIDADEAGAMSFKFRYINTNLTDEIYTKLGEKDKCKVLSADGIVLDSKGIVVRNPIPLKVRSSPGERGFKIILEPTNLFVSIYLNPGYYHIKWQNSVFFTNYFLFLFAWWGFWKFIISIGKYLRTDKKGISE